MRECQSPHMQPKLANGCSMATWRGCQIYQRGRRECQAETPFGAATSLQRQVKALLQESLVVRNLRDAGYYRQPLMSILPDHLRPGLSIVFCGTAVGTASASRGHYYAGPGNDFWRF